jgi:hypothetical protein
VFSRLIALWALSFSVSVSAADLPKEPTGKWVAEYGQDECLVSRPYGTNSDPLILTFRQLPMQDYVWVMIFKGGAQGQTQMGEKGRISFGEEPISRTFSAFDLAGKPLRRIETKINRTRVMPAVQSGAVSVDVPGEVHGSFSVPELGSALDVLADCALKLGAAWGIPIEQQKQMKTPPKLLPLAPDTFSYPSSALKEDMSGRTEVRLTVDDRGRPIDCIPLKSTPNQVFARTSCAALYRRAHFKPARDLDGKPMKSIYIQTLNFMIAG